MGHLSQSEPREVLGVSKRYAELEKLVQKAALASDPNDFKETADRFYSLLRSAWERSVEEHVFNQVVMRYQKEVKTLRLTGAVIDDEVLVAVFNGMNRGSSRTEAHDHATANTLTTATAENMRIHLEELKAFVLKQTAKKRSAEDKNGHLKGKS